MSGQGRDRMIHDYELPDGLVVDCFEWEVEGLVEAAERRLKQRAEDDEVAMIELRRRRDACPVRRDPGNYIDVTTDSYSYGGDRDAYYDQD